MSDENENKEVSEEDLEEVSGGLPHPGLTSSNTWKCPKCGTSRPVSRIKCSICGYERGK